MVYISHFREMSFTRVVLLGFQSYTDSEQDLSSLSDPFLA